MKWMVKRRKSNPDEFVAQPMEDYKRSRLDRYVLWNEVTKATTFKEIGQPPILLGHYDTINDAIKKVMKL